jgi:hypothetical protein
LEAEVQESRLREKRKRNKEVLNLIMGVQLEGQLSEVAENSI